MMNHILLDMYDVPQDLLRNPAVIWQTLFNVEKLTPTTFLSRDTSSNSTVIPCLSQVPDIDTGYSAVWLTPESHFTIHTYSEQSLAFVDYFSCFPGQAQNFVAGEVIQTLCQTFPKCNYQICTEKSSPGNYGKHLTFDFERQPIIDMVREIRHLVTVLGMRELAPMLISRKTSNPKIYAILQPIMESHIAAHCDGSQIHLDVFSCRDFNEKAILQRFPGVSNVKSVPRGRFFQQTPQ